jgi:hypothetical protein
MTKVNLSLSTGDLQLLNELVGAHGSISLKAELAKVTRLSGETETVLDMVCDVLAYVSGKSPAAIEAMAQTTDRQDLRYDVGLTTYHKQALKAPFNDIIKKLKYTGHITVEECDALVTIKDCVQLITIKK